ncbi:protein ANTAGONIST OF LIKE HETEROCHROMATIN PROTEIN 1-like [Impatiens glandulifera]|uniref:protein ANTAGONIST OF LIKE HETEROCHROMATIN PROTEIN 1-like n=1 Tax=Impatiens glandulifera TaxID=253017 RepID=UPI001FB0C3E8|nr:protein ANTAGONIST OF LIKE HETEROCHROMATIN PROTEIN 1-like [Impatiens glandulifera]
MDSRRPLAALLSPLISQLLILFLLLLPSSSSTNPLSIPNSTFENALQWNLLSIITHFVTTAEIAASFFLFPTRDRKRRRLTSSTTDNHRSIHITRDPDVCKLFFRMTSSTFEWLSGLLEPLLDCRDPIDSPLNLSSEIRLAIALFRLSSGADYPDISRRFNVSEPSARFCVKQFCRVLCTNFRFWVGFPNPAELIPVSAAFETLTGLPNCCGVISCTRFDIVGETSSENRSSIAAQIVVDSSSRILNIVAGFRGETQNFQILQSSTLCKDIESGDLLDSPPIHINGIPVPQYLVGLRSYPLLNWLVVPYSNDHEVGSEEEKLNNALGLMRPAAMRTIASLKKWGALSKPIEAEKKMAVAYIGACSILHNVLLMRDEEDSGMEQEGLKLDEESFDDFNGESNFEEDCRALDIRRVLGTRIK